MSTATAARDRTTQRLRPAGRRRGLRRRGAATAYALLAPNLVLFGLFLLLPLVLTVALGFQETSGFGVGRWIGLGNYERMAADDVFWRSAVNTVVFAAVTVPLTLVGGLGLALLLDRPIRGRTLFRSLFYLPYVLSGVVVALLGRWIFNENVGVVNKVLRALGGDGVPWQSSGAPAMASIIAMVVWQSLGFCMVIYLAGLQGIPRERYEAARVDGATGWQIVRYVTVPGLRQTTFFLTVLMVIQSFQVFDVVFVLTGGGPGVSTELLVTYAYRQGFGARQQGYASAIGVVMFVVVLAFTVLWWRSQRDTEADT
ncbi:carbohydrate ABC transporter permease [Cellulomonas aerilata]|uniref:ABC transporter permease n=1 Tax=Cellulomonas aerilata TaxID=515326 RepID=A0A512DC76_9CELL|nr:sugar ABC transporter permease [Cellulomonas aerilata]GEO34081.1 ABC transporter permease [Cellulomonas aerilata]